MSDLGQTGVTDEMVKRAANAIRDELESGYRTHWCEEWVDQNGGGCLRCREIARAALLAALEDK